MLVLGRRDGQSVLIGENIKVIVFQDGRNFKLGIEAPDEIPIVRSELLERDKEAS